MIENYLLFAKTNNPDRKNRKTELAHLKRVLTQVGKNIEKPYLGRLFIKNDMPKMPEPVFRYYSDAEIERLNRHIVNLEEQVARALILHQMLGGRISDTLTLRTNCIYQEHGQFILRIYQVKTSYYEKPIPAFCGAQRTSMRFRADAVQSITDALNRLLLWINSWAGSLQYSA